MFVKGGRHTASPWKDLQRQVLLGEEDFVEMFQALLADKEQVKEIPRPQRQVSRPSLVKLFKEIKSKVRRDQSVQEAHMNHGYTLKEIADHWKIRCTTISKVITKRTEGEK